MIARTTYSLITLPCLLLVLSAARADTVRHELSFPRAHNQYVHVESMFPAVNGDVELAMPVWTPGSYLVREYAANLEGLQVTDRNGAGLPVRKTAKNRWRVDAGDAGEIRVAYDIWAGKMNVSTNWVEESFALLNGAGVFLYTDDSRSLTQEVTIRLPAAWAAANTAMESDAPGGPFRAIDYDELVDSPILAGNTVASDFEVDGHDYGLVFSSDNRLWDGEKAAADAARIVSAHQEFWGTNPFWRKYLFMAVFDDSFAGLEHDHSTVLMADPWSMRDDQDYIRWLGLLSHEFFHAWNVRRMRPEVLSEYDYDRESYTRELWLAEGLTSYYDDLLLFRSGLISVEDYFRLLAGEIRNYETTPGRAIRSAEQASFDTWIKHYRRDENSVNSTVSYYRKGALIGFVADTAIRRETDNKHSLDTVMRAMYGRYGLAGNVGYPPGAFEDVVEEVAGPEVRRVVEDLIRETVDPDVDAALAWYGLSLDRDPGGDDDGPQPAGFGMEVDLDGPALVVQQVVAGHAAAEAGVLPGDELIAVDGNRVTRANYSKLLGRLQPGEDVELVLARRGQLLSLAARTRQAIPAEFRIMVEKRPNARQKSRMERWLGRELAFQ